MAGNGEVKISSVACRFSSIKIHYSNYPKSLISKINEVYVFIIKYRYRDILLKKIINFILAVCFAVIIHVIVLPWFL